MSPLDSSPPDDVDAMFAALEDLPHKQRLAMLFHVMTDQIRRLDREYDAAVSHLMAAHDRALALRERVEKMVGMAFQVMRALGRDLDG